MERFEGRDRGIQIVLIALAGEKITRPSFSGACFVTRAYKNMK